jgi:hypothetical protein
MSFLFSLVSGVAGGIFRAMRNSSSEAEATPREASVKLTGSQPAGPGTGATEAAGGSFAQRFRAHMTKATDANGDGVISRDELAQRLAKGGASAADATTAADKQYKAMDKNGDGIVSVDEYKNSLEVPTSPLVQHVLQMIEARRATANAGSAAAGAAAAGGTASI